MVPPDGFPALVGIDDPEERELWRARLLSIVAELLGDDLGGPAREMAKQIAGAIVGIATASPGVRKQAERRLAMFIDTFAFITHQDVHKIKEQVERLRLIKVAD